MAITTDDFNKIWASTSPLTPYTFSNANYKQGWNFVGATPPARQMWDSYMKFSDEKQKYIVDNFLPLRGGTMTGTLTQEQPLPSSRQTYQITYTNIEQGVSPSSASLGYLVRATDSAGNTIVGVSPQLYAGAGLGLRMYLNWGSGYARTYEFAEQVSGSPCFRCLSDNVSTLGASNYRWKQLFAGTATIDTSDERVKDNIEAIPDAVLDAWGEVGWYQFQFKDAIAKKGENARIHTGTIAQRIKETFEKHNLDAFRYGLLCYDSWDETEEEKDENGKVVQEYRPAGDLYSLRYEEALCMESAYQRRRADRLEARLNALEERIAKLEG